MNVLKSVHDASFWSAAFASVACLLSAAQIAAADPAEVRSVTVSFRDVNLSTLEGATTLYQRLRGAARSVCGDEGRSLREQYEWKVCYQRALGNAVRTVDSPLLTAVSSGRNHQAQTAMRTK